MQLFSDRLLRAVIGGRLTSHPIVIWRYYRKLEVEEAMMDASLPVSLRMPWWEQERLAVQQALRRQQF